MQSIFHIICKLAPMKNFDCGANTYVTIASHLVRVHLSLNTIIISENNQENGKMCFVGVDEKEQQKCACKHAA